MKLIYISLFVIFYFLIKEFFIRRFTYSNPFSNYENFENLSNTIFINNKSKYDNYQIKKQTKFGDTFIPILLTDYKYSEVFKLGYELKKLFPLKIRTSEGMYSNLSELVKENNSYQMAFCTENDYYKAINDKVIKKEDVNFVCSFYRLEFILILNDNIRINNYKELISLIIRSGKDTSKYLKIGLLDENHSSHHDGIELLKLLKITKDTKGITIMDDYRSMRDLIDDFDNNELDMIYLTTTSKNPYLINYLKTNFINIIGTDGINDHLIKIKFPNVFKETINISKYNRIVEDTNDTGYFSSRNMGKKTKINTYSTRLFLVAKKTLPEEYVLKLIRNIYGSLIKLKKNMNDYFLNNRNNTLNKSFDPYEMFFIKKNLNYHKGAKKFYEEINFINYTDQERPFDKNIYSKLLTDIVSSNELMSIKKYDD
jgi:TRAP-type uncharacterized transport system substrate-binding protein